MSFDRLAPHYRWMERVLAGGMLQRARTAWLGEVGGARRVLLAGEGPGRFLDAALEALPEARFVVADASSGMLKAASSRVPSEDRLRVAFEQGAFPNWRGSLGTFDLVVTHFFLDCFGREALSQVLEVLDRSAAPGASWLLADFAAPARGWSRRRARLIHSLMYAFFRLATGIGARELVPPEDGLRAHGWRREGYQEWSWGLVSSSLWRRVNAGS